VKGLEGSRGLKLVAELLEEFLESNEVKEIQDLLEIVLSHFTLRDSLDSLSLFREEISILRLWVANNENVLCKLEWVWHLNVIDLILAIMLLVSHKAEVVGFSRLILRVDGAEHVPLACLSLRYHWDVLDDLGLGGVISVHALGDSVSPLAEHVSLETVNRLDLSVLHEVTESEPRNILYDLRVIAIGERLLKDQHGWLDSIDEHLLLGTSGNSGRYLSMAWEAELGSLVFVMTMSHGADHESW
jgi:hypothetical protein